MAFPNLSHIHNWEAVFTEPPTISNPLDLKYIHSYIRDFSVPSVALTTIQSNFQGNIINHPITHANSELSAFTLALAASENYENYLYFLEWILDLRYGNYNSKTEVLRRKYIAACSLNFLDNQKRKIAELKLRHLFPTDVSSINLNYQSSEENYFTITFTYDSIGFERINV